MATLYSGPGKVYVNAIALFPEGENGAIRLVQNDERGPIASAMHGKIGQNLIDQTLELTVKPFDHWGSLRTLFPASIGVAVGVSAAALVIGTRPHGDANVSCKIWTPDGRLYDVIRSAVIGHPSLHLGVGKALFGDCRISGLWDIATEIGTSPTTKFLNVVGESAQADPGGAMAMSDFIRGAWTGVWGAVAGFNAIEAEEEWTIENEIRYSPLKKQGRTMAFKLDSVSFMARCRPYGPTHTQILAAVNAHTHGQRLGSADLTLTGPSGKTITLENAEAVGAGFEFGGTQLGTGEIGFVNEMTFTAGAPQSLLTFSA